MKNILQENRSPITGSVQVKNGKWYAVLNLYDEAGKRKPKWIPTGLAERGNKRKAEEFKRQCIEEYERRAELPAPERTLFADFAKSWLESKKGTVELSTWENYENVTTNHIIPWFRKKKLAIDEIKPAHIREYYTYKSTKGRLDRKKGGLSHATMQKHSSVLKLIFDDAVILEEVTRNPALAVKLQKNVEDNKDEFANAVFLNVEQANTVINAMEGEVLQPIVYVCLYYGLRRSEALGLKWDAISFEEDSLSIKSTVVKHKTIVEKDRTKSKKSKATFALLPEVKQLLLDIWAQQKKNRRLFGKAYVDTDYIFTWPDGHMIRPDYVTHRFQKVLENKGLPVMTFHQLRHSCASILYDKGWNVKDIQEWLRHADIETTMNIYTHISEQRKKILAKDLENTFHIGPPMLRAM